MGALRAWTDMPLDMRGAVKRALSRMTSIAVNPQRAPTFLDVLGKRSIMDSRNLSTWGSNHLFEVWRADTLEKTKELHMATQALVRATPTGKAIFDFVSDCSNFAEFDCLVDQFGEFGYLVKFKKDTKRVSGKLLESIISEVETAARSKFGQEYQIKEFVLVGI